MTTSTRTFTIDEKEQYDNEDIDLDAIGQISLQLHDELSEIVEDNTAYRRGTFAAQKTWIKRHCRGFRVRMAALLSTFDIVFNVLVSVLFLLRGYTDMYFDFYIWSAVVAFVILLTSIVSYRMGPAGSMDKLYYCFQIGICFECQNSLEHNNFGHATYTFKLITFIESCFRSFPLSIIKLFVLIWYNDTYPFWATGTANWILMTSIIFSILSYSFWFTYRISATLRDRYNNAMELLRSASNHSSPTMMGSYSEDPSVSTAKYMNNCNKIIFCLFIALDIFARCGVLFIMLRYFPRMYSPIINYIVLLLLIICEEICSLLLLHRILPQNDITTNKYKAIVIVMVSMVSVSLLYDAIVKSKIDYNKKYFVLYVNMVSRLMLMCLLITVAIYTTSITKGMQLVIFQLQAIQFILITFTTFIVYLCEKMIPNVKKRKRNSKRSDISHSSKRNSNLSIMKQSVELYV